MYEKLIQEHYGLNVLREMGFGAGSRVYLIETAKGRFLLKFPEESAWKHPALEPKVCDHLWQQGIPVCSFVPGVDGETVQWDAEGRFFTLQRYFEGMSYPTGGLPENLLFASAMLLGRLHMTLADFPALPEGVGCVSGRRAKLQEALDVCGKTLALALERGEAEVAEDARDRLKLLEAYAQEPFPAERLTTVNSHGDYRVQQLICALDGIRAVVDWTSASTQPAAWELLRSFAYAAPFLPDGRLDRELLRRYIRAYQVCGRLNEDDLALMPRLLLRQLAASDCGMQYLEAAPARRGRLWEQLRFDAKLRSALQREEQELSDFLASLAG